MRDRVLVTTLATPTGWTTCKEGEMEGIISSSLAGENKRLQTLYVTEVENISLHLSQVNSGIRRDEGHGAEEWGIPNRGVKGKNTKNVVDLCCFRSYVILILKLSWALDKVNGGGQII